MAVPLDVNAAGDRIMTTGVNVWTGTTASGEEASNNCSGWTSTSAIGAAGRMIATSEQWTSNADALSCKDEYRLYCVEVFP